jgi:hypothetical protein
MNLPSALGLSTETVGAVIIGGGLLLVVLVAAAALYREHRRRQAWQALAGELGFKYSDRNLTLSSWYPFRLFQRGHRRRAENLLSGEAQGRRVFLTDYRYTTGSGGSGQTTHRVTLCILETPELDLPFFYLRPERFLDTFGEMFGGQDIDFEDDPAFSRAFVLQGEDEARIREVFTPEVRGFCVRHAEEHLHAEGSGKGVLVHCGRRIKPGEHENLMTLAFGLAGHWTEA